MKSKTKLLGKIQFDEKHLKNDLEIISKFPVFEEEYSEFNSGVWINNSLWNNDGDYRNTQYKDNPYPAKVTELGKKAGYIDSILHQYFDVDHIKMVRTRNLVNGQVIPHKDFIELDENKGKYTRILIPLETSLTSYHSDEDYGVFRMCKGDIWMLDASVVHAAYNFGSDSRVILCLDFQYDNIKNVEVDQVFKDRSICNSNTKPMLFNRASLRKEDINDFIINIADSINNFGDIKKALLKISSAHVYHNIPIKDIYDILIQAVKHRKSELYETCIKMKNYYTVHRDLGERFTYPEFL